jgi:hypothetical protein
VEWGDDLDLDRWASRDPLPWDRVDRARDGSRTLTIGCNVSAPHQARACDLLYRGAAALALADLLAEAGCSVGLALFACSLRPSSGVAEGVVRCEMKEPGMPLDVAAVAFAVCEVAFYRCIVVCAAARRWPGLLTPGLGQPAPLPAADRVGVDFLVDTDVLGERAAVEWLRRQAPRLCHA